MDVEKAGHGRIERATEVLKQDHRVIERALAVLERCVDRLRRDEPVERSTLEKILDFFRGFADKCHHEKEEHLLFPLLVARGIPKESGPIGVMLMEHEDGRRFISGFAGGVEELDRDPDGAKRLILENALRYTQLLREHIYKEDNILFAMADSVLAPEEQRELVGQFEQLEHHLVGHGVHDKYVHLVEELEKEAARWPT